MDTKENPNHYFNSTRYKPKYICTDCRKVFKRKLFPDITSDKNIEETEPICSSCRKPTIWIGPKFRAPKADNIKAWKSLKVLHDIGLLHFMGWANIYVDIPETTKALNDFLKDKKTEYEWNINKWITSDYSVDNKTQIKYFSEAINKLIDTYI